MCTFCKGLGVQHRISRLGEEVAIYVNVAGALEERASYECFQRHLIGELIGELVWCTKALMQQELVVLLGNGTLGRQGLEHWRRLSKYLQPKPTGLQEEVGSLGPRLEI